jgi:hypothetical protein
VNETLNYAQTLIVRVPVKLREAIRRIAARNNQSESEMLRRFLWSQVLVERKRYGSNDESAD